MKPYLLILLTCFPFLTYAYRTDLSTQEVEELKSGKEILRVEELDGEVFPRVTLINVIPHSPKQNMKVFSDFENHKNFLPGLLKSEIVKKEGDVTDVSFEMKMPIVKNTQYTTQNKIIYEKEDAILTWELVESKQIKQTKGLVMFEEFEGKTLFTYVSHITPNSSFAWAVKSRVVPDVKKSIQAVIKHLSENAGK